MKLFLYLALGVLLSGCGCTPAQPAPATAPTLMTIPPETETAPPETSMEAVEMEPAVLYEEDGIRITATGLADDWMGCRVNLLVENQTQRNIVLTGEVFGVNGITIPGYLYAQAAAGMKTNDSLELYTEDLQMADIREIAFLRGSDAKIMDTDSQEVLASVPMELQVSRSNAPLQTIDESGDLLWEHEKVTVLARSLSEEHFGQCLSLLVKNTAGKDLILEAENISVNGYTLDGWLYDRILADTVRYSRLDIFSTGLRENDIGQVKEVTFTLRLLDGKTLETMARSEPLTVAVKG